MGKEVQVKKPKSKVKASKIKGTKLRGYPVENETQIQKGINLKKFMTKANIVYLIVFLLDVFLIIYVARKNIVHCVSFAGDNLVMGDKKNLFFGRNYISILITMFFYLYICTIHSLFLKRKVNKKFLIGLFFGLFLLNVILFYVFTIRIY